MDIELSKPQGEFYQSDAKNTAVVAGFGSGKTEISMFKLVSAALEHPDADFLYAAPTVPLIRDILISKLSTFLPALGIKYNYNKSESIVYLYGYGKIYCRSMMDPDRLVGFEVLHAFLDEVDILPTDKAVLVYQKIKARCRQKVIDPVKTNGSPVYVKNQIFVSTTPEGFRGTYELFKKNPAPDTRLIQMSTYSNQKNLPDDYISDLKATYPQQLIDAYLNGIFTNLTSMGVWSEFDREANHLTETIHQGEELHIGQDFNVGRGCAVVYVFRMLPHDHPKNTSKKNLRVMVAVGEIINSFDTPDTIRALNEHYPPSKFRERLIYPDATGINRKSVNATITDLAVMRHAGFQIKQQNVNPPIKDRVTSANAAFCNGEGIRKLFVDTDKCPVFTEALMQQAYDKNNLPEKGVNSGDDVTDAGTYPVVYHYPVKANKMFHTALGGL